MALVTAVLYFALVELMLVDAQRELEEARRFRARVVAEALAENAAELAALEIVTRDQTPEFTLTTEQGTLRGSMTKSGNTFDIHGEGTTSGLTQSTARVYLRGAVSGKSVWIHYSLH
jgi:hypothetical protein